MTPLSLTQIKAIWNNQFQTGTIYIYIPEELWQRLQE